MTSPVSPDFAFTDTPHVSSDQSKVSLSSWARATRAGMQSATPHSFILSALAQSRSQSRNNSSDARYSEATPLCAPASNDAKAANLEEGRALFSMLASPATTYTLPPPQHVSLPICQQVAVVAPDVASSSTGVAGLTASSTRPQGVPTTSSESVDHTGLLHLRPPSPRHTFLVEVPKDDSPDPFLPQSAGSNSDGSGEEQGELSEWFSEFKDWVATEEMDREGRLDFPQIADAVKRFWAARQRAVDAAPPLACPTIGLLGRLKCPYLVQSAQPIQEQLRVVATSCDTAHRVSCEEGKNAHERPRKAENKLLKELAVAVLHGLGTSVLCLHHTSAHSHHNDYRQTWGQHASRFLHYYFRQLSRARARMEEQPTTADGSDDGGMNTVQIHSALSVCCVKHDLHRDLLRTPYTSNMTQLVLAGSPLLGPRFYKATEVAIDDYSGAEGVLQEAHERLSSDDVAHGSLVVTLLVKQQIIDTASGSIHDAVLSSMTMMLMTPAGCRNALLTGATPALGNYIIHNMCSPRVPALLIRSDGMEPWEVELTGGLQQWLQEKHDERHSEGVVRFPGSAVGHCADIHDQIEEMVLLRDACAVYLPRSDDEEGSHCQETRAATGDKWGRRWDFPQQSLPDKDKPRTSEGLDSVVKALACISHECRLQLTAPLETLPGIFRVDAAQCTQNYNLLVPEVLFQRVPAAGAEKSSDSWGATPGYSVSAEHESDEPPLERWRPTVPLGNLFAGDSSGFLSGGVKPHFQRSDARLQKLFGLADAAKDDHVYSVVRMTQPTDQSATAERRDGSVVIQWPDGTSTEFTPDEIVDSTLRREDVSSVCLAEAMDSASNGYNVAIHTLMSPSCSRAEFFTHTPAMVHLRKFISDMLPPTETLQSHLSADEPVMNRTLFASIIEMMAPGVFVDHIAEHQKGQGATISPIQAAWTPAGPVVAGAQYQPIDSTGLFDILAGDCHRDDESPTIVMISIIVQQRYCEPEDDVLYSLLQLNFSSNGSLYKNLHVKESLRLRSAKNILMSPYQHRVVSVVDLGSTHDSQEAFHLLDVQRTLRHHFAGPFMHSPWKMSAFLAYLTERAEALRICLAFAARCRALHPPTLALKFFLMPSADGEHPPGNTSVDAPSCTMQHLLQALLLTSRMVSVATDVLQQQDPTRQRIDAITALGEVYDALDPFPAAAILQDDRTRPASHNGTLAVQRKQKFYVSRSPHDDSPIVMANPSLDHPDMGTPAETNNELLPPPGAVDITPNRSPMDKIHSPAASTAAVEVTPKRPQMDRVPSPTASAAAPAGTAEITPPAIWRAVPPSEFPTAQPSPRAFRPAKPAAVAPQTIPAATPTPPSVERNAWHPTLLRRPNVMRDTMYTVHIEPDGLLPPHTVPLIDDRQPPPRVRILRFLLKGSGAFREKKRETSRESSSSSSSSTTTPVITAYEISTPCPIQGITNDSVRHPRRQQHQQLAHLPLCVYSQ